MEKKKSKLTLVETFSGVSMTKRGFDNSGVFDVETLATCETDANAIISRAAIHDGLTPDLVENYTDYPSREEMAQELSDMHINYDFVKDKEYDWFKVARSKDSKNQLKNTWLACKLSKNVGDIARVKQFPKSGMLTFSFPCTDLSVAGKQKGMEAGETRSGLVWEVIRILKNMKNGIDDLKPVGIPNFLLMENVDALINKKNLPSYEKLNKCFEEELGYKCVYKVLNTKELSYDAVKTPQNRKRVFALYYQEKFEDRLKEFKFPTPFDSGIRLKDVLYDEVDLSAYVYNDKVVEMLQKLVDNGTLEEQVKLYNESKNSQGHLDFAQIFLLTNLDGEIYVHALKQEQMREFQILDRMVLAELNYKQSNGLFVSGYGSFNNPKGEIQYISSTICARSYKGFDNFGMTGVIEIYEEEINNNEHN